MLTDTLLGSAVTELTSFEYEAQLHSYGPPVARPSPYAEAVSAIAAAPAASPRTPMTPSQATGGATTPADGPTTSLMQSPGPSSSATPAASGTAAASSSLTFAEYAASVHPPLARPNPSAANQSGGGYGRASDPHDPSTLLGALNGAACHLEPTMPSPSRRRLSDLALGIMSSDPDGFVRYPESPARVPHVVRASSAHIDGVPYSLCLACYDCPCSCAKPAPPRLR